MIKGRKLTLKEIHRNQKSPEVFLDFIYLVENAELSVTDTDQKQAYKFNGFSTSEAFENRLIQLFEEITQVIRSSVKNIFDKEAKLEEINFYIDELESLENNCKQDGDNLRHSNFKIEPDSSSHDLETLSKSKFVQGCLSVIRFYISKSIKYFKGFGDDIRSISQSDFPIPEYLQPKSYDSSDKHPFRYFEYLIAENGITELKNKLMTLPEGDEQHQMKIDRINEVITYYTYEDGEEKEYVQNVPDLLIKEIRDQRKLTEQLLKGKTGQFTTLKDAEEYFKIQVLELKRLFKRIPNKNSANTDTVLKQQLIIIAEFILDQFNEFLGDGQKSTLQNIIKFKTQAIKTSQPRRYSYAFDLQNISIDKLMKLSSIYLKSTYIMEEELPLFRNIFTCEIPEKKLSKIHWQARYNGKTSKQSLIYLFYAMQKAQLIIINTPDELKFKLPKFFCDADGASLATSIQSNYYQFEKSKGKHPNIDRLILLLTS